MAAVSAGPPRRLPVTRSGSLAWAVLRESSPENAYVSHPLAARGWGRANKKRLTNPGSLSTANGTAFRNAISVAPTRPTLSTRVNHQAEAAERGLADLPLPSIGEA